MTTSSRHTRGMYSSGTCEVKLRLSDRYTRKVLYYCTISMRLQYYIRHTTLRYKRDTYNVKKKKNVGRQLLKFTETWL